ncbi:MAG: hypothetical protein A4E26_00731 [Methanobacterium sp. PtaU1.Bin097]|nr:MAG: hypothetical protein A4E26_00731 [Methanobacterium sp. PtaU1.Bin097]
MTCKDCKQLAYACGDYFCKHPQMDGKASFLPNSIERPDWCPLTGNPGLLR